MSTSTRITYYKNEILGQGSYGTVFKGEFSNENDENCSSTTEWKRFKDD